MRRPTLHASAVLLALAGTLVLAACSKPDAPAPNPREALAAEASAALVKRGEYLVGIGGCNHCHTPMAFDAAKATKCVAARKDFVLKCWGDGVTGATILPRSTQNVAKRVIPVIRHALRSEKFR